MTDTKRLLRVFLCHASGDKPVVRKLYERLVEDGIDAWLDKEKLIPGQNWQIEISNAVKNSDVVIVCLSSQSITKEGYVQKEIKFALDVADEKPDGTIFIIPARLENCDVPQRISKFQWVDLFSEDGYEWLLKALQIRAESVRAIIASRKSIIATSSETELKPKKSDKRTTSIKSSAVIRQPQEASFKKTHRQRVLLDKPDKVKSRLPTKLPSAEGNSYYFSSTHAMSPWGKYYWRLYEKKGVLRLTQDVLSFSNSDFVLNIQADSIKSIETKIFSRIARPVKLSYISIKYIENKRENTIGLVPLGITLEMNPMTVWHMNEWVSDWIEILERNSKLASKIIRPLRIPSPSETTVEVVIFLSLLVFLVIVAITWLTTMNL